MLIITTKDNLFYNYDKNTWHEDIIDASVFEDSELDVLIDLIDNQDQCLEVRNLMSDVLHANYAKDERIDTFLS